MGNDMIAPGSDRHAVPPSRSLGVCTFWLCGRHFGLDVGIVREVVTVESVVPVPRAPTSVRGLFTLRGVPVALLDFVEVLALSEPRKGGPMTTALVLEHGDLLVGVLVAGVDGVVPADRGVWTQPAAAEHPAVGSFLTLEDPHSVVTVIDTDYLLGRLERVRSRREVD